MKNLFSAVGTLALAGVVVFSACKKPADPGFTASAASVKVGEPVVFTDNETDGRKHVTYHWDFGDGEKSFDRNPSHIYWTPGDYIVNQTITYNKNLERGRGTVKSAAPMTITVTGPTASFTASATTAGVGEPVTFTNTSTDAATYQWSWASSNGTSWTGPMTTNPNLTITFPTAGTYWVYLMADVANSNGSTFVNATPVEITVGGGVAPTTMAGVAAMLHGKWTVSSDNVVITGASAAPPSSPATCDWINTSGTAPVAMATSIWFNEDGTVNVILPINNQVSGQVGAWTINSTGTMMQFTGGAGFTYLLLSAAGSSIPTFQNGFYSIIGLSATTVTLKYTENCQLTPSAVFERTIVLTR